jgi:ceramide glucosyltransferase
MFKHQLRWARSTRRSRPLGYFGLSLTYGTPIAIINFLIGNQTTSSVVILIAFLLVRLSAAWWIGVRNLKDQILKRNFWLIPARDILSFLIWTISWIGKKVEWRGRTFEVTPEGKLIPS